MLANVAIKLRAVLIFKEKFICISSVFRMATPQNTFNTYVSSHSQKSRLFIKHKAIWLSLYNVQQWKGKVNKSKIKKYFAKK